MFLEIIPLFSLITSIFLLLGIYFYSIIISETKNFIFLRSFFGDSSFILFFSFLNFILILSNFFIIFFGINPNIIKIISSFFIFSGVIGLKKILNKFFFLKFGNKFILLKLLLILFFLVALFPITDPDSFDYHMTVPKLTLEEQQLFIKDFWLQSNLFGFGEILIMLGQAVNSFNVSQLTQFFSLLMISTLIINYKNEFVDLKQRVLIITCILIIPTNLFLIFSSKPQLYSICSNFTALFITLLILPKIKKEKEFLILFILISLLSLPSTQFKYSFYLSSGIILFITLLESFRKKFLIKCLAIFTPILLITILPREIFEYLNFSENIIKNFFNPAPYSIFQENYVNSLKVGHGNNPWIPIWIFLPVNILPDSFTVNLGQITNILGFSILLFIFNTKLNSQTTRIILLSSFVYFILGIIFGQPSGRFFYEPFLWLFIICLLKKNQESLFFKIFKFGINIQVIFIIIILSYSCIKFLPGNFSNDAYKKTLRLYADGYQFYEWINKTLQKDSIIISTHRSQFLSSHKVVTYELRLYIDDDIQRIKALEMYNSNNPTHIVYTGNELNDQKDFLQNCRGKLVHFKKDVGKINFRNPFNDKNEKYDGYIFNYDKNKVLECIKILRNK